MNSQKFNRLLNNIKNDKKAIIPIYQEYYSKIVIHLRCRFGRIICHEDIAQEVFAALLNLKEDKKIDSPTQWILAVADNKAIDFLRTHHEDFAYTDALNSTFDLNYSFLGTDIQLAFVHIDSLSRKILYMHFWEGYSYKQIAEILHVTSGNVRLKASRAYKELKKHL